MRRDLPLPFRNWSQPPSIKIVESYKCYRGREFDENLLAFQNTRGRNERECIQGTLRFPGPICMGVRIGKDEVVEGYDGVCSVSCDEKNSLW
jgi:hypothetical protein